VQHRSTGWGNFVACPGIYVFVAVNLARRAPGCYRYVPRRARAAIPTAPRERTTVAEINVERKPRSSVPIIAGVLLLAVLGFVIWRYVSTHQGADADAPVVVDSTAR
jgi:hypothetical protein